VPDSYLEFYDRYKELKRPIDLDKVTKKTDLPAYLQGNRPSSSLGHLVGQLETMNVAIASRFDDIDHNVESRIGRMESELRSRKYIEFGAAVTVLGLLCGFFFYLNSQLNAKKDVSIKAISDLQSEFTALRMQFSEAQSQTRSQLDREQVANIKTEIAKVKAELDALKTQVDTDRRTNSKREPSHSR
jgi:hypothetical protein